MNDLAHVKDSLIEDSLRALRMAATFLWGPPPQAWREYGVRQFIDATIGRLECAAAPTDSTPSSGSSFFCVMLDAYFDALVRECGQTPHVRQEQIDRARLAVIAAYERASAGPLLTGEQFEELLHRFADSLADQGKPIFKHLLAEARATHGERCRFANWPERLRRDVYDRLGFEPVLMYRKKS